MAPVLTYPATRSEPDAGGSSVDGYLQVVAPHLPPELIGTAALSRIRDTARMIPAKATSFLGFECHLTTETPDADFLFCARADTGERSVLAGEDS